MVSSLRFRIRSVVVAVSALIALVGASIAAVPVFASPPPKAQAWVVTLGDSYISGEGERWAGNTSGPPEPVDALGADAYFDSPNGETISGCHRAEEAEAYVDFGRMRGKNFACSGAQTETHRSGGDFKPGIDFYNDGAGHKGQALLLQEFAADHRVTDVVVSIGGNDFGFAPILRQCIVKFVTTVNTSTPDHCRDDPAVTQHFTDANVDAVTDDIAQALRNVATAMERAGYSARDYRIVVQNYPSPLPPGEDIRYSETVQQRFLLGGCPFFDEDADYANTTVLATINSAVAEAVERSGLDNVALVDMSDAFLGHRLCEEGVVQFQQTGLDSWQDAGAVDALAWVNMLYVLKPSPWQLQESVHPNYWGTLAMRDCIRQSVRGAGARSGTCVRTRDGLQQGEPMMKLVR